MPVPRMSSVIVALAPVARPSSSSSLNAVPRTGGTGGLSRADAPGTSPRVVSAARAAAGSLASALAMPLPARLPAARQQLEQPRTGMPFSW